MPFSATVSNAASTAVTWSVIGSGTVSPGGVYSAPGTPGLFQVVATSVADPTKKGTARVNVTASGGGGGGPPYVLAADRATQWKPGATLNGGIPNRTTVCATLDASAYGNGASEASGAIQSALDACPAGQVVALSAGTFRVNNHVRISKGITLRGAGAGVTTLQKTNGSKPNVDGVPDQQPIVIIGPERWPSMNEATATNLTADAAKGDLTVTLASAAGFAAGQVVLLDELSNSSWRDSPLGRGQIWGSPDGRVTWQFHNPGNDVLDDPLTPTVPTGGDAASWFSRRDRVTNELKEIASVSGNTVTFTTPVHISYRSDAAHKAQLTRFNASSTPVKGAGLENLTVWGGADGAVRLEAAVRSWAKNVEVTVWTGEGFAIDYSFQSEVRDSYVHDAAYAVPGGGAYAISLANGSSEILVENNISRMANKVMVARACGAGSVFAYNYTDNGMIRYAENWIEMGLNASHMVGPHHVLFEGNYGANWDSDMTHGSAIYHTVFRNWLRGIRSPFVNPETGHTIDDLTNTQSGPKRCAGAQAYSYWMSFVGNVLGAAGMMNGWVYAPRGTDAGSNDSIFLLGWDDKNPYHEDPMVFDTTVRDGNWDWLQAQQTWHNTVPSTLPDSLYLTGKPAFFGANPWPWVDPTTGTVYTLPAKARYDAGTPNVVP
jgi:hypothetical protein